MNSDFDHADDMYTFPYELIETTDLSDKRLCSFLSDLFLDTEVDYKKIAWLARHYPLAHVETLLFRDVAPVCHVNLMAVIPPVWFMFDPDELWRDITQLRQNEERPGGLQKLRIWLRDKFIRWRFQEDWLRLQSVIAQINAEMGPPGGGQGPSEPSIDGTHHGC